MKLGQPRGDNNQGIAAGPRMTSDFLCSRNSRVRRDRHCPTAPSPCPSDHFTQSGTEYTDCEGE